MQYKHIQVNTLLNKIQTKDVLFSGDYTLDPYKNCDFGCLYCDSSFEKIIYVKQNAGDILKKELKDIKKGTIIVGSVHDPYQRVEKNTGLTRKLLRIIMKQGFSCHILTKSDLILRDLDVLLDIGDCKVTVSITSLDRKVSQVFEKNVPSPEMRMHVVKELNKHGIQAGVALIPMLPFIVENELEDIVKQSKNHGSRYFLFKPLELKGDQKRFFINVLKKHYPYLVEQYTQIYKKSYKPDEGYINKLNDQIIFFCKKYGIPSSL